MNACLIRHIMCATAIIRIYKSCKKARIINQENLDGFKQD